MSSACGLAGSMPVAQSRYWRDRQHDRSAGVDGGESGSPDRGVGKYMMASSRLEQTGQCPVSWGSITFGDGAWRCGCCAVPRFARDRKWRDLNRVHAGESSPHVGIDNELWRVSTEQSRRATRRDLRSCALMPVSRQRGRWRLGGRHGQGGAFQGEIEAGWGAVAHPGDDDGPVACDTGGEILGGDRRGEAEGRCVGVLG